MTRLRWVNCTFFLPLLIFRRDETRIFWPQLELQEEDRRFVRTHTQTSDQCLRRLRTSSPLSVRVQGQNEDEGVEDEQQEAGHQHHVRRRRSGGRGLGLLRSAWRENSL